MELTFLRINENYTPQYVVEGLTKVKTITKYTPSGKFRLTEYVSEGISFYSYGLTSIKKSERPGHGGEWSSRPQVINDVFDVKLTSCSVRDVKGSYPNSAFTMAINIEDVIIPDSLKAIDIDNDLWTLYLVEKGEKFPRSGGYWSSTTLNAKGELIHSNKQNEIV